MGNVVKFFSTVIFLTIIFISGCVTENNFDTNSILFEKNSSWGPCPSTDAFACIDNYSLYYSGRVLDNGVEKYLSTEKVNEVLAKIKYGNLNLPSCFVVAGTDYFVNYRVFVDGKEFDSSKIAFDAFGSNYWPSEDCMPIFEEIELIVKSSLPTNFDN